MPAAPHLARPRSSRSPSPRSRSLSPPAGTRPARQRPRITRLVACRGGRPRKGGRSASRPAVRVALARPPGPEPAKHDPGRGSGLPETITMAAPFLSAHEPRRIYCPTCPRDLAADSPGSVAALFSSPKRPEQLKGLPGRRLVTVRTATTDLAAPDPAVPESSRGAPGPSQPRQGSRGAAHRRRQRRAGRHRGSRPAGLRRSGSDGGLARAPWRPRRLAGSRRQRANLVTHARTPGTVADGPCSRLLGVREPAQSVVAVPWRRFRLLFDGDCGRQVHDCRARDCLGHTPAEFG